MTADSYDIGAAEGPGISPGAAVLSEPNLDERGPGRPARGATR